MMSSFDVGSALLYCLRESMRFVSGSKRSCENLELATDTLNTHQKFAKAYRSPYIVSMTTSVTSGPKVNV